jgi:hypothetical protein
VKVVEEVVNCIGALASFDSVFEDFSLVLVEERSVYVDKLLRRGSDVVDKVEGVVDEFIEVHRYLNINTVL